MSWSRPAAPSRRASSRARRPAPLRHARLSAGRGLGHRLAGHPRSRAAGASSPICTATPQVEETQGTRRTRLAFQLFRHLVSRRIDGVLAVSPSLGRYAAKAVARHTPSTSSTNPVRDLGDVGTRFASNGRFRLRERGAAVPPEGPGPAAGGARASPARTCHRSSLTLVGSGPEEDRLRQLSPGAGAGGHRHFAGYASDPAPAISAPPTASFSLPAGRGSESCWSRRCSSACPCWPPTATSAPPTSSPTHASASWSRPEASQALAEGLQRAAARAPLTRRTTRSAGPWRSPTAGGRWPPMHFEILEQIAGLGPTRWGSAGRRGVGLDRPRERRAPGERQAMHAATGPSTPSSWAPGSAAWSRPPSCSTRAAARVLVVDEYDQVGGNHIDRSYGPYTFDIGSLIFQDDSPLLAALPRAAAPLRSDLTDLEPAEPPGQGDRVPVLGPGRPPGCGPARVRLRILGSAVAARLRRRPLRHARDFGQYWIGPRLMRRSGLESYMERFFGLPADRIDLEIRREAHAVDLRARLDGQHPATVRPAAWAAEPSDRPSEPAAGPAAGGLRPPVPTRGGAARGGRRDVPARHPAANCAADGGRLPAGGRWSRPSLDRPPHLDHSASIARLDLCGISERAAASERDAGQPVLQLRRDNADSPSRSSTTSPTEVRGSG